MNKEQNTSQPEGGTQGTCKKLPNGKFLITVGNKVVRKASGKAFPFAYIFNADNIKLSDDAQCRRCIGVPKIVKLESI